MSDGLTPLEKELLRCVETSLKRIELLDERLISFGKQLEGFERDLNDQFGTLPEPVK